MGVLNFLNRFNWRNRKQQAQGTSSDDPHPFPFGMPGEDWRVPFGSLTDRETQLVAYERSVWVRIAVQNVANAAARIPVEARHKDTHELFPDHRAARLLRQANPHQTQTNLLAGLISYRLLTGDGFCHIIRDRLGVPRELFTLPPHKVRVVTDPKVRIKNYVYTVDNEDFSIPIEDMVHLREWHGRSGYRGLGRVETISRALALDFKAQDWNKAFFENFSIPAGFITPSDEDFGKGQLEDILKAIERQTRGPKKAHRTIALPWAVDVKQAAGQNPHDAQFLDQRKQVRDEIGAMFGVPPILMGDYTSVSFANARAQLEVFWENTVVPVLADTLDTFNEFLMPQLDAEVRLEMRPADITALIESRNETTLRMNTLLQTGTITRNEARDLLGIPRSDDEQADKLFIPVNMAPTDAPWWAEGGGPNRAGRPRNEESEPMKAFKSAWNISDEVQSIVFDFRYFSTEPMVNAWLGQNGVEGAPTLISAGDDSVWVVELWPESEAITTLQDQRIQDGVRILTGQRVSSNPSGIGASRRPRAGEAGDGDGGGHSGPGSPGGPGGASAGAGGLGRSHDADHTKNGLHRRMDFSEPSRPEMPLGFGWKKIVKQQISREREEDDQVLLAATSKWLDRLARITVAAQRSAGEPDPDRIGWDADVEAGRLTEILTEEKTRIIRRRIRILLERTRSCWVPRMKQEGEEDIDVDSMIEALIEMDPYIAAEFGELLIEHTNDIAQDIKNQMSKFLTKAANSGFTLGETIEGLMDLAGISESRADAIARTEAGSAYNTANFAAMNAVGVQTKTWSTLGPARSNPRDGTATWNGLHHPDHDAEEANSEADPVPIGEPFRVTNLNYPLDPAGPAHEVVRCRCVVFTGDPEFRSVFTNSIIAEATKAGRLTEVYDG